ncbi:growth factor receptor-bound protein 7-like [Narcine bancroftii]|uniref:growth factor receptor-bound protein 7-like n=1 Tax=Narcine bancroftii TaxID=1343680 RepID=UPI0038313E5E
MPRRQTFFRLQQTHIKLSRFPISRMHWRVMGNDHCCTSAMFFPVVRIAVITPKAPHWCYHGMINEPNKASAAYKADCNFALRLNPLECCRDHLEMVDVETIKQLVRTLSTSFPLRGETHRDAGGRATTRSLQRSQTGSVDDEVPMTSSPYVRAKDKARAVLSQKGRVQEETTWNIQQAPGQSITIFPVSEHITWLPRENCDLGLMGSDFNCSQVTDADVEFVALEHSVNTKLDNLYQKEVASMLPNAHMTSSRTGAQSALLRQRSQSVHIQVERQLKEEVMQTSSLPNPFSELSHQPRTPTLSNSSKPPATRGTHVVTIFSEDGMGRSLEVMATVTAQDVCGLLLEKNRCVDEESCVLVETHPEFALERCLEDHELLVELQANWPINTSSKFIFRKYYAKYEFFRNPEAFFPTHMLAETMEADEGIPLAQLAQNFLNARNCPEVQGFLHLKEKGKKTWKRLYFFLRRSGFYYSTKGTSKEPRHLQYFADVNESNIYTVTNRKMYNTPTDYAFCLKLAGARSGRGYLGVLCSEDEQGRTCWMTAFRMHKLGPQLCLNYRVMQQRKNLKSSLKPGAVGNVSENCLVPMDFSGCKGRVIENPKEASLVAEEEAYAWRKKGWQRHSLPGAGQGSSLCTAIHKCQPWFHGRISREEAHRLIVQHGHTDGVFLIRESQRTPESFVLTLSHHHKTKHFLVAPCEDDGQTYLSVDTGQTKFSDLTQLVDFYQMNRGVLPCSLKHSCSHVSL